MTYENKLPAGFESRGIDPDNDKKLRVRLYVASGAAAVLLLGLGCLLEDISLLFDASGAFALLFRFVIVIALLGATLVGQEYLKCILFGHLTGKPARVVREKLSARIEYKCWLDRKSYVIMSLVPAGAICLVLLIFMLILPDKFFWQCYIIFVVNLVGAAGDAYTAYLLYREKADVRVKNDGYTTLIATEKK